MSGGVAAALGAVIDGQAGGEALEEAGIFEGLDELDLGETGALDAPSPLSEAIAPAKRGGRRKGSKNRRTEATIRWLLEFNRHPLAVMMEAYGMSPRELAARIGILEPSADQILDLFKLQLRMAEAVAPYVAQRLPQAVTVDASAHVTIGFEGVSLPARAAGPGNSEGVVIEGEALRLPFKSDG